MPKKSKVNWEELGLSEDYLINLITNEGNTVEQVVEELNLEGEVPGCTKTAEVIDKVYGKINSTRQQVREVQENAAKLVVIAIPRVERAISQVDQIAAGEELAMNCMSQETLGLYQEDPEKFEELLTQKLEDAEQIHAGEELEQHSLSQSDLNQIHKDYEQWKLQATAELHQAGLMDEGTEICFLPADRIPVIQEDPERYKRGLEVRKDQLSAGLRELNNKLNSWGITRETELYKVSKSAKTSRGVKSEMKEMLKNLDLENPEASFLNF